MQFNQPGPLKCNTSFNRRDYLLIVSAVLLITVIYSLNSFLPGLLPAGLSIIFAVLFILVLIFKIRRENVNNINSMYSNLALQNAQNYSQVEALFSVFNIIKPKVPFPPMQSWAIYPDFAALIIDTVLTNKPKVIVEASSGISTVISAYCLKKLGEGRVISFDHDNVYATQTKLLLSKHGLEDTAEVHHAPLKDYLLNNRKYKWYDVSVAGNLPEINLLIIDGPPRMLQVHSRYPALPVLFDRLSTDCVILLDDGQRRDEREILDMWLKEFASISQQFINNRNGAYIIRKAL